MRNLLLILAVIGLGLSSCKLFQKAEKEATVQVEERKEVLVRMNLTPCFGTCPVYQVAIYPDGMVEYNGVQHTDPIGNHTSQLPTSTLNDIREMIQKSDLASMKDKYDSNIPDFPSVYLTVDLGEGQMKKITTRGEAPASLKSFQKYIIRLVKNIDDWKKVEAKQEK